MKRLLASVLPLSLLLSLGFAAPPAPIPLWPEDAVPGETQPLPPESDLNQPSDGLIAGRPIIRLGNVSTPTLTVYSPDPAKNTGAAILVFPGGGYHILAMDLEGTEVCEWLNSIGVTGVLVKYRVPRRANLPRHAAALQDAQRAMSLVRHRAQEWHIDPDRIGALGFSAGAHLSAALAANHADLTYPKIDAADAARRRPDFLVLLYPGSLTLRDQNDAVAPEVAVTPDTPPTFLAMTQDDRVRPETALFYYLALKNAGVPAELHLYPKGGHGYGLRPNPELTVTTWPARVEDWMRVNGWLNP